MSPENAKDNDTAPRRRIRRPLLWVGMTVILIGCGAAFFAGRLCDWFAQRALWNRDPAVALEWCQRAAAVGQPSFRTALVRASIAENEGDMDAARSQLDMAVELGADSAEIQRRQILSVARSMRLPEVEREIGAMLASDIPQHVRDACEALCQRTTVYVSQRSCSQNP